MDVPYHSSGAIGRAHYSIVRKVETSDSVHIADQHIMLEIETIKSQLAQSRLDIAKCKECLLILLYCSLACSPGVLPSTTFNFAFFPAINLAERGRTLDDKRIGYRFCIELMPLEHEAGLMLVNTLRKDLESDEISYICLALDSLLALPTEHMIAAVQDRLNQLIDHDSPLVRRRTILAFRSLASQNPIILERIKNVVLLCLHDDDESVSHATLALLSQSGVVDRVKFQQAVKEVLSNKIASLNLKDLESVSGLMPYLKIVSPIDEYVPLLFKILRQCAKKYDNATARALIVDVFRLLSSLVPESYSNAEREQKVSAVRAIRAFLKSSEPDDVYIFFTALECVPVAAWAGTDADHPAVLTEDEFQRMLEFLNHPDPIIRIKVMKVIFQVDQNVLDTHIALLHEAMKNPNNILDLPCCLRTLEASRIRYAKDGSKYAEMTLELLQETSQTSTSNQVFEAIVDCILRDESLTSRQEFGRTFARTFLLSLSDSSLRPGPTTLVIASALAVEFAPVLGAASALRLLSALGSRLSVYIPPVQEPCILAMIRLCAEVDQVPQATTDFVTALTEKATRSVRKYCRLFLEFSRDRTALQEVIHSCQSSSLPDFLVALSLYRTKMRHLASSEQSQASPPVSRHSQDQVRSGPSSRTPSRLRFATNDASSKVNLQASRLDLISLESPFHAEDQSDINFGETWDKLGAKLEVRGWSMTPVGETVDKIRGLNDHQVKLVYSDLSPFVGELKLVITPSSNTGLLALRLRPADDDTCLYRIRSDEGVAATKQLITQIVSPS